MHHLFYLALFAQLFIPVSLAQSRFCNNVRTYLTYNATNSSPIPALKHQVSSDGRPGVVPDDGKSWNLTSRLLYGVAHNFIDTGDSDTSNMGLCFTSISPWNNNFFRFSKKVLRRAATDPGDCKTMFGEQCVEALRRHFTRQALDFASKGECPTLEYGFTSSATTNSTVPWECMPFVGNASEWNSELVPITGNLTANLSAIYSRPECDIPLPGPLPPNTYSAGVFGSSAPNHTFRFSHPSFFLFFPNYTSPSSNNQTFPFTLTEEDVQVHISCMRPEHVAQGSTEPPTAEELLSEELGAEWHESVRDVEGVEEPDVDVDGDSSGEGEGEGGAENGTAVEPGVAQSTGGVAPLGTLGPVVGAGLGVAAVMAML
ncbi:hypothetical protein BS50DRAFT_615100 [Corynespora cassiicola Philippines]|uniref:Uncharacterized protein n=1 Tax=Corynespora cassiicola Philippines TaxID=1448308 RepID=A0A2T2P996_CORCC|nr:hypothetical protein BS50DRAFT_615100 [Corynespora cassiicola Philippines]